MDPNPKSFPILSYVMSRLHLKANPSSPRDGSVEFDIEQPPALDRRGAGEQVELVERMPHLKNPELLASMRDVISDVAQTRSVLHSLGERPDHEVVDAARDRIAVIEADLSRQLEELVSAPLPGEMDGPDLRERLSEREEECRTRAEREKYAFKAVIQLDEMHEAYEKLLREAEDRLVKMYESVGPEAEKNEDSAEGEVNAEVIEILQEASGKVLERVDLSGRQLMFLPEAFGKLHGLLVLNLSNNQLEAIPDSIAGLGQLEELRLSSNLLSSLPDSIGLLPNLKILDVSGNKLKTLPDSISHCRSLVELDVSFNQLAYLPTSIGHELLDLQKLLVYLNKIRSLPSSVCEMRSLCHLDAHFNELQGLPHAFGRLTNLEFLDLSSNFSDLTELPETIGDLTNLKELNLSNNQIHELPVTFGRLKDLTKLNLDQNPLVIPPMEIVKEGVEAVKEYMSKRWLDILLEEQKTVLEENSETRTGWLTRSTSWLNKWFSGVSGSVAGYLGTGEKQYKDPCLDQQF